MVNNFELIKKNLHFQNERSFYFIQILKRKKENPEMKSYSQPIENFYIFDTEQLERVMPHIIEKCEQNRARAYIKMNCLDAQSVMLETISVLTQDIRNENWKHMSAALNSACGICGKQNGNEKLYLVDLDGVEPKSEEIADIKKYIDYYTKPIKYREVEDWKIMPSSNPYSEPSMYKTTHDELISKIKLVIPTRNGCHLLTTGFDKQAFKEKYPNVDIHDDGITLLYFPKSCN